MSLQTRISFHVGKQKRRICEESGHCRDASERGLSPLYKNAP